jgi:hypothetical protein
MCVVNKNTVPVSIQATSPTVVRPLNNPVENCRVKRSLLICPACEIIRGAQQLHPQNCDGELDALRRS